MQIPTKLSSEEINLQIKQTTGWTVREDKLHKIFKFRDFAEAFGFMASCAVVAESMNHHPEWSNVYNTVEVYLTTHDVSGLSENDFTFANRMNEFAVGRGSLG